MSKFILKRLLYSIVILFFVMLVVYLLMYSLPSSYVENKARELAMKPGSQKSAAEWLKELNAQYGMDKGVIEGYFTWLKSAVKGNFGESWAWTVPVTQKFKDVIWYSFALGLVSFILEIIIAIPLGVMAARKQYSITDYTVTVVSLVGISLPTFFVATLLKMVFGVWIKGFDGQPFLNMRAAYIPEDVGSRV